MRKVMFLIAVIAFAAWYFMKPPPDATTVQTVSTATAVTNSATVVAQSPTLGDAAKPAVRTPDTVVRADAPTSTTKSDDSGFLSGLFVGVIGTLGAFFAGGFLVASAGIGVWIIAGIVLLILMSGVGVLSEYSASRISWWGSKRSKHERVELHEMLTTLLFISSLAYLEWAGVPVISTLIFSWWGALIIPSWMAAGVAWSIWRWRDYRFVLHEILAATKHRITQEMALEIKEILELRETSKDGNSHVRESSARQLERNETQFRSKYFPDRNADWVMPTDELLSAWLKVFAISTEDRPSFPSEFASYITRVAEKQAPTKVVDNKGQVFLWVFYWPFSAGFRAVRNILELRVFHDIFNAFLKRFGHYYDKMGEQARIQDNVVETTPPAPTGPKEPLTIPVLVRNEGNK